jgi:hypothetical protein
MDANYGGLPAVAAVGAAGMIAHQVGGKATRDALFLSHYPPELLPTMVILAGVLTLALVMAVSRLLRRRGPTRLIPAVFAVSGVLCVAEWALVHRFPAVVAIVLYFHVVALGAVTISGFWSLVTEIFDPRSARREIHRIAGSAALGGLLGGLVAERVAAGSHLSLMLLILGGLHLLCAVATWRLGVEGRRHPRSRPADEPTFASELALLGERPYLRSLVALVLTGAVVAVLLDYVFKAETVAAFPDGATMLRFFALFYTGAALLTLVLQTLASRRALEGLGIARTVSALPFATFAGAVAAIAVPGLAAAALARGAEQVVRSSLYRSGYELLFTPLPDRERRATKTIIDVAVDRAGDVLGGGLVLLLLLLWPDRMLPLLAVAALLALVGLSLTRSLHRGYLRSLERSLLEQAVDLDTTELIDQSAVHTMLGSIDTMEREELKRVIGASHMALQTGALPGARQPSVDPSLSTSPDRPAGDAADPILRCLEDLRSGDGARVRAALAGLDRPDPLLVPQLLSLLAWDRVAPDAARALSRVADVSVGQFADALLDPDREFAIRRRVPSVLGGCADPRSTEALLQGLADPRFEVRFRCGRALAKKHRRSPLGLERKRVFAAVVREVKVDARVWRSYRLLDGLEEANGDPLVDDFLHDRVDRGMEHVFTLLSLVLEQEPLKVAFRGLHTDDRQLRGTALEYLSLVLPESVRAVLWPFLEGDGSTGST